MESMDALADHEDAESWRTAALDAMATLELAHAKIVRLERELSKTKIAEQEVGYVIFFFFWYWIHLFY